MTSTSAAERRARAAGARPGPAAGRVARPLLVAAFWVAVWHVAAVAVGQDVLLASPAAALARLGELALTADLWATVGHSLLRIAGGFLAATVAGTLAATAAAGSRVVDALVTPLLTAVRTTPVVSFIVLVLMWAGSSRLALVISFLMVLPVTYTAVLEGIRRRDRALLEAAEVFAVPAVRRLRAVDVPAVLPFLVVACRVGVGLAWKSGVAAEVIGLAEGSIGERLHEARILLSSADLIAWTVVVVAVSHVCERLVIALLGRAEARLARDAP